MLSHISYVLPWIRYRVPDNCRLIRVSCILAMAALLCCLSTSLLSHHFFQYIFKDLPATKFLHSPLSARLAGGLRSPTVKEYCGLFRQSEHQGHVRVAGAVNIRKLGVDALLDFASLSLYSGQCGRMRDRCGGCSFKPRCSSSCSWICIMSRTIIRLVLLLDFIFMLTPAKHSAQSRCVSLRKPYQLSRS